MNKITAARGLAVFAAATGLVLMTAAPASAAQAVGSCSVGGYSATLRLNYTNTGTHHAVTSYSWTINGQSSATQNNVLGRIRRVVAGGNQTLHSFSRDDVRNGNGSHPADVFVPYSYSLYADMEFIFDVNNLPDPRCTAVTPTF